MRLAKDGPVHGDIWGSITVYTGQTQESDLGKAKDKGSGGTVYTVVDKA